VWVVAHAKAWRGEEAPRTPAGGHEKFLKMHDMDLPRGFPCTSSHVDVLASVMMRRILLMLPREISSFKVAATHGCGFCPHQPPGNHKDFASFNYGYCNLVSDLLSP
jgi:hypothetical protein